MSMAEGEFLMARSVGKGIRTAVQVVGPDHQVLGKVETPEGMDGPLRLRVLAIYNGGSRKLESGQVRG